MKSLIEKLRAAAEKAGQYDWIAGFYEPGTLYSPTIARRAGGIIANMTSYGQMREDAQHIATASPENIRKLCNAVDKLVEALKFYANEENDMDLYDGSTFEMEEKSMRAREALKEWESE